MAACPPGPARCGVADGRGDGARCGRGRAAARASHRDRRDGLVLLPLARRPRTATGSSRSSPLPTRRSSSTRRDGCSARAPRARDGSTRRASSPTWTGTARREIIVGGNDGTVAAYDAARRRAAGQARLARVDVQRRASARRRAASPPRTSTGTGATRSSRRRRTRRRPARRCSSSTAPEATSPAGRGTTRATRRSTASATTATGRSARTSRSASSTTTRSSRSSSPTTTTSSTCSTTTAPRCSRRRGTRTPTARTPARVSAGASSSAG